MLKRTTRQIQHMQRGRFNGFLRQIFGGAQCIQSYLKDRTFQHFWPCNRILPVWRSSKRDIGWARAGRYFPHKGDEGKRKGKGKGKGKGKRKGLVAAGLDVGPYMGL